YRKTAKGMELNFISVGQGLGYKSEEDINHRLSLLFRELNLVRDLFNELCLCHAFRSPAGGIHRTAPEHCVEVVAYSSPSELSSISLACSYSRASRFSLPQGQPGGLGLTSVHL